VLAQGDVREELIGEPEAGDLLGDLRTLAFDEGDPVPAVADAEFLVLTFTRSHDLFSDGSVVVVDLAGHTPGSVGVLLRTAAGHVLLAGDAAWHKYQVDDIRQKSSYPGGLADEDRAEAFWTLHRLHAVKDRVTVVPTHDPGAAKRLQGSANPSSLVP
jgi:glyoxylase-like metal-dependent hydrolase (beta-lactamase superfamily II)